MSSREEKEYLELKKRIEACKEEALRLQVEEDSKRELHEGILQQLRDQGINVDDMESEMSRVQAEIDKTLSDALEEIERFRREIDSRTESPEPEVTTETVQDDGEDLDIL